MLSNGPSGSRLGLGGGLKVMAVLVGLGIPALVAGSLYQQRGQELHAAEVNTANTVRALEQHAARTVETVDTFLQAVVSLAGSPTGSLSPETIHAALRDKLAQSNDLTNILILDAHGDALHEAVGFPARSTDRRDHDYLQKLRDDPNGTLFIGSPITGRRTKLPILPIARRINHADGSFAGVIVATLKASAFQSVFDGFDLGPNSTLGLWRSDGTLLVRAPHVPALIGKNYAATENYKRYVQPKDTRPFWSAGSTDGIERVLALGFVPSYPLYVSATQARDTALAGWRQAVWMQGGIAGGLTLVVVVALLALARALTQRRRSEEALAESEALHRLLSENSSDMIAVKPTFESRRSYVSPASVKVAGWAPDEFAGMLPSAYVHPDDLDRVQAEYATLTRDTPSVTSTHRVRHKAGHWIWAEATFALVSPGTSEERVIATSRNVTARRMAEDALMESEGRYRLLAEAATDMIVLADVEGVRRYVSPASRALLGYEPEELVGTHPAAMSHPEDAHILAGTFDRLRDGVTEQVSEMYRLRRKDGTYVWVEAKLNLVRDKATGAPTGILSAVRDASERQRQSEELRAAKEAAEAAAEAKGEFLASMSHELRTPLNGIIGFSGLMAEGGDMALPTMQHYARLVHAASTTLLSIVNDVLDVSKLEAGSLELDLHPFAPRHLVEHAAMLLREQAAAKGLALHVEVDAEVPEVLLGDEARLRQVLLNLLSNAVKFTAKGMVWLYVDHEGRRDGLARVRFTVMDTGIGIPADKRHRLFQRFSQVDGSTARQFGGTGLGLSICKSLIEMMGGSIRVDSTEGEGSSFTFTLDLPVAEVAADAASPSPSAQSSASETGAHILLAEDVAMNQELAVAMLTRWGHSVDVVPDGAIAVDAVMRNRYDLVLMDVQMPVMDGLEATRRIRGLGGAHAELPIIAMTANVLPRDVERCRLAGADAHIGKPFVPEILRALVTHWAGTGSAGPEAGPAGGSGHDGTVLDDLGEMIGPARLATMLRRFVAELDNRLAEAPADAAGWQGVMGDAHALISTAGMLGFTALSEACRTLEQTCQTAPPDGSQPASQLQRVREEVDRARAKSAQLIAAWEARQAA
ncbi:PAS domain S-box protein [Methylobacterium iners]|uniref:histidine kinase n=1 Tax=Methylobacterium iners TaxID=418707 RepID=A0ABQ4S0M9_9HYPH|nr:PAS domain S-box protein [Methylobacterium iners]GJD96683.1 Sensor histidine kinase RcsC [Methylobacterium iners]